MKVAYVAGPYNSTTINGVCENIQRAREVALKYWRLGYSVICPHMNTAFMDGENDVAMFLAGDIEILKRCDVLILMRNWENSEGARGEYETALDSGLTIIRE